MNNKFYLEIVENKTRYKYLKHEFCFKCRSIHDFYKKNNGYYTDCKKAKQLTRFRAFESMREVRR